MTFIEKPSQLPIAIGDALKGAFPQLRVGNHQDFQGAGDKTGVLITVERNGPGVRSLEGRKAHALSVSLMARVASGSAPYDACDLASQLMDLALDNRWGLPSDQCDLPSAIVAFEFHLDHVPRHLRLHHVEDPCQRHDLASLEQFARLDMIALAGQCHAHGRSRQQGGDK